MFRVVNWNMRRATARSGAWHILTSLNPDVALLQEVSGFPDEIKANYWVLAASSSTKSGQSQKFSTAIIARPALAAFPVMLSSGSLQVDLQVQQFAGNLLAARLTLPTVGLTNVVSVYVPAWPILSRSDIVGDLVSLKLTLNKDFWATELLWALLKESVVSLEAEWLVGGDFNSSETFDLRAGKKPRGNLEFMARMNSMGLHDCLRAFHGRLVPTFRNPRGREVIHQLDHLYATPQIIRGLQSSMAAYADRVFGGNLSDHLPVISDFELEV